MDIPCLALKKKKKPNHNPIPREQDNLGIRALVWSRSVQMVWYLCIVIQCGLVRFGPFLKVEKQFQKPILITLIVI